MGYIPPLSILAIPVLSVLVSCNKDDPPINITSTPTDSVNTPIDSTNTIPLSTWSWELLTDIPGVISHPQYFGPARDPNGILIGENGRIIVSTNTGIHSFSISGHSWVTTAIGSDSRLLLFDSAVYSLKMTGNFLEAYESTDEGVVWSEVDIPTPTFNYNETFSDFTSNKDEVIGITLWGSYSQRLFVLHPIQQWKPLVVQTSYVSTNYTSSGYRIDKNGTIYATARGMGINGVPFGLQYERENDTVANLRPVPIPSNKFVIKVNQDGAYIFYQRLIGSNAGPGHVEYQYGGFGYIFSNDGGKNWVDKTLNAGSLNFYPYYNGNLMVAVQTEYVLVSGDGGSTFVQSPPISGKQILFFAIDSENFGYAFTESQIYRTSIKIY